MFGAGYDYAYLFPGIRKVVQAAGRVIRTASDRGTVHLIDDRFVRTEVLRLLPKWWSIEPECGDSRGHLARIASSTCDGIQDGHRNA
jgi:Rad3-related DNA helicase